MTREEYNNVQKFYQTLKLKDFGELNKIYNFQDTVILCEIFEQRSGHLQKLFKFNPRKCNSASSLGGCVHRDKSKCLIVLPTKAEHVRVFEKTLIGGFSCVNTRLKKEHNFDEIKDAFDHAAVPVQLEFFYGGDNENFVRACKILSPNEDDNEYKAFFYQIKKMKKQYLI